MASNIASAPVSAARPRSRASIQCKRHSGARPSSRGQPAQQLAGDLTPRSDARQLEQEDRCVCRGCEPHDDVGREHRPELRGRRGPAQPARDVVDVVELAPVDRGDEPARRDRHRIEPVGRGLRDRGAEGPELGRDGGDPGPGPVSPTRRDEGQQRGPGDQLERGVEHERVGRVLAGHGQDLADLRDEAGIGGVGGCREQLGNRHPPHPKTSTFLEVKGLPAGCRGRRRIASSANRGIR